MMQEDHLQKECFLVVWVDFQSTKKISKEVVTSLQYAAQLLE